MFGGSAEALILLFDETKSGEIVVGLESFIFPEILDMLALQHRLLNNFNPHGFIPAEGAVAMLIFHSTAEAQPVGGLGAVTGYASRLETEDPDRPNSLRGRALAQCVGEIAGQGPFAFAVAELNGERYRSEEFGFALALAPPSLTEMLCDPFVLALQTGHMGTASGLAAVAISLARLQRSRSSGERVLILAETRATGQRVAVACTWPAITPAASS